MWQLINGVWRLAQIGPTAAQTILGVRRAKLSYLEVAALADLHVAAVQAEKQGVAGVFIEAGSALGGSAIVLGQGKRAERPLLLYDAFGMIPPPSDKDGADAHQRFEVIGGGEAQGIKGDVYYGYQENLLETVKANLTQFGLPPEKSGITLVQGFYEETLRISEPVALAHLDCDWYESVMVCLREIVPHLVAGGRLIIDDYAAWSGCKTAVDEYFAPIKSQFNFEQHARLHIVKK